MRNKKDKGWKEVKELNFFTLIHRLASRTVPKSLAHVGRTTAGNNNICATIIPSPTAPSLPQPKLQSERVHPVQVVSESTKSREIERGA